jgi:Zn-dependent metalloprotease
MKKKSIFFWLLITLTFSIASHAQYKPKSEQKGLPFLIRPDQGSLIPLSAVAQVKSLIPLSDENDFQLVSQQTDDLGYYQEKFQQTFKGVKVEYGEIASQTKNYRVQSIAGEVYDIPQALKDVPSISESSALDVALNYFGAQEYKWQNEDEEAHLKQMYAKDTTYFPSAELVYVKVYLPNGNKSKDEMALAYRFDIYSNIPLSRRYIYVDAHEGVVVHDNQIIHDIDGQAATRYSGTRTISTTFNTSLNKYILKDVTRGQGIETYNMAKGINYFAATQFTDADNNWTSDEFGNLAKDNVALDAHWSAMMTYDFFKQRFNRNSYDNKGSKIKNFVHYGQNYVNAFWDGQAMTYGDGSGSTQPLTSLDICAHEIGHAICSSSADLIYLNESGALNEGLSDIWGATVEHFAAPEKSPWELGEDINMIIRSMSNPNQYGQPDTYMGTNWYTGSGDNGGVHINSGVMNHWYYILVTGKSGVNDHGVYYNVQGIDFESASSIAYRMETAYLTSNSKYLGARIAAIQAATDLFGEYSNEVTQTSRAWDAVGVYDVFTAPSDMSASVSGARANISWTDNSTDAISFAVERSLSYNTGFTQIALVDTVAYVDDSLQNNTTYYYRVKAIMADHQTAYSGVAMAVIGDVPLVMSNMTVSVCGVSFQDPGGSNNYGNNQRVTMTVRPGTVGKKVKVSFTSFNLAPGDYLSIYEGETIEDVLVGTYTGSTLPSDINSAGLSGALTFQFFSNASGTSSGWLANLSCIDLPPGARNFVGLSPSDNSVEFQWFDDSDEETAIVVERGRLPYTEMVQIATLPPNTTSFLDENLPMNDIYLYRVRIYHGTSYSESSYGEVYVGIPPFLMKEGSLEACDREFLDTGGNGAYLGKARTTMTITPQAPGTSVSVIFSQFDLEEGDYLYVYDGSSTSSPLIGAYTGTTVPPAVTATNLSGKLTFRLSTSGNPNHRTGWVARVSCGARPAVPFSLTTQLSGNKVNLAWLENASDEDGYIVERSLGFDFTPIATLAANTQTYQDASLVTDKPHVYRVRALTSGVASNPSNISSVSVGNPTLFMRNTTVNACGVPFYDSGVNDNYRNNENAVLTISPVNAGDKVTVSFTAFDLSKGYDYLRIYDGASTSAPLLGSYTGNTLPPALSATNAEGKLTFNFISDETGTASGWRAQISCSLNVTPPTGLRAIASANQVALSWQDNSTIETGYVIERSSDNLNYAQIAQVGASVTYYTDATSATGNKYYRVKTMKDTNSSLFSNTAVLISDNTPLIMQNGKFSGCDIKFVDSGNTGYYGNNENKIFTVLPGTKELTVRATFTNFVTEQNFDFLYVYDGLNVGAPLLGAFTGSTLPPVLTATNADGALTFNFVSDKSVVYAGWNAILSCVVPLPAPIDLRITLQATTQIGLTWVDQSTDETAFIVELSTNGIDFEEIASLAPNTTSYQQTGLNANMRHYYRVKAVRNTTSSRYTNVVNAITGSLPVTFQDGSLTLCGNLLLDAGSFNFYDNNENKTLTLTPATPESAIRLKFTHFDTEADNDILFVYDGTDTSAPLLGSFSGTTVPSSLRATNPEGKLTLQFITNGTVTSSGWEANVTCIPLVRTAPVIVLNDFVKSYGDAAFQLNATAYADASFSYSLVTDQNSIGGVIALSGAGNKTVTINKVGTANLKVSVPETDEYLAGEKIVTITVNKGISLISGITNINKVFSDAPFDLNATSFAGSTLTYSLVSTTDVVALAGKTVTILKTGTVQVKVSVAENANYLANEKVISLTVAKANQTIQFDALQSKLNSAASFTLTATTTSGLPVSYVIKSGPATISGNTVTLTKELGTVTIEAVQTGNDNFNAAESVMKSFEVTLDPVLAVNDQPEMMVKVWPVPAREKITVNTGAYKIMSLSLIDMLGKTMVQVTPGSTEYELNLESMDQGIYMLRMVTENGQTHVKRIEVVK